MKKPTEKKHLVTVHSEGRTHAFLVKGITGDDGKTRIAPAAKDEALRRAGATRGKCIKWC